MQLAEAFKMVKNLCDNVRTTKQERLAVDEALSEIAKALQPKPPEENKKD